MVFAALVLQGARDSVARRVQPPQPCARDIQLDRAVVEYLLEFFFSSQAVAFMPVPNLHEPLVARRKGDQVCRIEWHQAMVEAGGLARKYQSCSRAISTCLGV